MSKVRGRPLNGAHVRRKAIIESAGDCTRPIEVRAGTMADFGLEAAHRGMSTEALLGKVLDGVAEKDLFAEALDR